MKATRALASVNNHAVTFCKEGGRLDDISQNQDAGLFKISELKGMPEAEQKNLFGKVVNFGVESPMELTAFVEVPSLEMIDLISGWTRQGKSFSFE